jgi:predicted RNA-binding protein
MNIDARSLKLRGEVLREDVMRLRAIGNAAR